MIQWYAFQSKARKEQMLCEQLRIRGIDTFFPYLRVQPVNPRARKVKPYFPGYVFGRIDLEHLGRSILDRIPGGIGIVSFGGQPAPVSDHLINTLHRHLALINAVKSEVSTRFQRGDVVAIHGGPFAGYEAIFDASLPSRDRVELLLKILQGSQIRIELPIEQIASR